MMTHHRVELLQFITSERLSIFRIITRSFPKEMPYLRHSVGDKAFLIFEQYKFYSAIAHLLLIAACAAARRAIGTRNGEQDT